MNPNDPVNPYLPPGSDVNVGLFAPSADVELADRSTRFVAFTLDGLLACIPFLPMLAVGMYFVAVLQYQSSSGGNAVAADIPGMEDAHVALLLGLAGIVAVLGLLGLAIYQWVLISRTGQSLGKKWTGIRIELLAGSPVNFTTGVVLRNWVPKFISMVPYLGMFFSLVDALFIFREDRRCVHDHIAGTRVVRTKR
jgi:uncharacterized RDD family membrane protein YckC